MNGKCYQVKDIDKNDGSNYEDNYNILKKIPTFHKYRKKGNMFDDIYTIEDNISRASGILITGEENCTKKKKKRNLQLGNQYSFISGKCGSSSSPECIGKNRHIIVDNIPANRKGNKGLIPSIIGDITDDLNPGTLLFDLIGKGKNVNDKCSFREVHFKQFHPNSKNNYIAVKRKKICVPDYNYVTENFENKLERKKGFIEYSFTLFLILMMMYLFLQKNKIRM